MVVNISLQNSIFPPAFLTRSIPPLSWLNALVLGGATLLMANLSVPNAWGLWGSTELGFFAYVPFFYCLFRGKNRWMITTLAAILGGSFILTQTFWLGLMQGYGTLILSVVSLTNAGIYALGVQFFWHFARRRSPFSVFLIAACWAIFEFVRSIGMLAFPWNYIFHPFHHWLELNQIVSLTGVWALSFLIASTQGFLALLLFYAGQRWKISPLAPPALFITGLFLLLYFYGRTELLHAQLPYTTLDVLALQTNQDPWIPKLIAEKDIIRSYLNLQDTAKEEATSPPDLIVWSEGNILYSPAHRRYTKLPEERPLAQEIQASASHWLIGSRFSQGNHRYHGAVLSSPSNLQKGLQAKVQLVPFAEGNPLEAVGISNHWLSRWNLHFFSYGQSITIFQIPNQEGLMIPFAVPICFEDAFPSINRVYKRYGAQLLINLTDDSWSATPSAELQHFITARYRSIELRLPMLRSTNSGFSVLVDPYGRILAELPLFTTAFLRQAIPIYPSYDTVYYRWGDWLIYVLIIFIVGTLGKEALSPRQGRDI